MKYSTIILTTILIGFTNPLNAQVEFPVLDAKWCYSGSGDVGENLGTFCFSPEELIDLGGQTYSKIKYRILPGAGLEELLYREEDRRFYVIPQDSVNEIVVYDFNLAVGDTFRTNWGFGLNDSTDLIIQSVDTITTLDGVSRKKITLENGQYQGTWLEGIGSLEWIFVFPAYTLSLSGSFHFICHSKKEEIVYIHSQDADDCDFTDNLDEHEKEINFEIYPNPAKDKVNIDLKNTAAEYLLITDLTGKIILEKSIKSNQYSIQIADKLEPGIYLVKIMNQDKSFSIKKFIALQ